MACSALVASTAATVEIMVAFAQTKIPFTFTAIGAFITSNIEAVAMSKNCIGLIGFEVSRRAGFVLEAIKAVAAVLEASCTSP